MNIEAVLERYGLTNKEVVVYLTLLQYGRAKASALIKKTGISRATVYFILESLQERGLVLRIDDSKIAEYVAEDPKRIIHDANSIAKELAEVYPAMMSMWGTLEDDVTVRHYKGLNNIKRVYDELLIGEQKKYKVFGSTEYWMRVDKEWFTNYIHRRATAGISVKLILESSEEAQRQKKLESTLAQSSVRLIPETFTNVRKPSSDVTILADRIIFQNYGRESVCTVFHSREAASLLNLWHDMTWDLLG